MAYNIALQFEDGVTRMIKCEPHELVCDAAYKVKINIRWIAVTAPVAPASATAKAVTMRWVSILTTP